MLSSKVNGVVLNQTKLVCFIEQSEVTVTIYSKDQKVFSTTRNL